MTNKANDVRELVRDFDVSLIHYLNGEYDMLQEEQRRIYCENIPEFDNTCATLRSLCDALGIAVPPKFESIADQQQKVAFRAKQVKPGYIFLVIRSAQDFYTSELRSQYQESIERGAKLVIMGREEFETLGLDEEKEPVILTDHHNDRILRFFSIIRKRQKAKVVLLTGSVGKTTTKDLCYTVANSCFAAYANENNTNTPHQVAQHVFYKTDAKNDVFIHEAGAGYFGSVRLSASILQPDIFILTNVFNHHLQVYKTFENLFSEKVSSDDYLSKNGVVITNYDDENIRNHAFKHTVKSFSIHYPDADYRALNISQYQENLSFDVYEKATGKTTHLKVNILGEHNVYNILTAFAMGKALGMEDERIAEALREYRTVGVRQNLTNVGGVHLLLDCYNVAEESILAMLSAGEKFQLEREGKRIALIGGENKLGKDVKKRSLAFGEQLAKYKIDQYLFCGTEDNSTKALNHFGDAQSIWNGFKNVSQIPSQLSLGIDDMVNYLRKHVKQDDLVMVKGIYYLQMPIAVDKVLGTSFSFGLSHNKADMKTVCGNDSKGNLIADFGELELTEVSVNNGTVTIPDVVENYPVFRVKNNTFQNRADISSICFGGAVKNIGAFAFSGCENLKELIIPWNVKVIEDHAFSSCKNLTKVTIRNGVTHISNKAFADCANLEEVRIPVSVGMVEDDVFAACPNVTVVCKKDSVAHRYAMEHKLSFRFDNVGLTAEAIWGKLFRKRG